MRDKDLPVFNRFLSEIRSESDRGLALIGAAFLDEKLAETLAAFFCINADTLLFGKNAPLTSFSARIECCHALGLIDDIERHDCDYVRRIRNEFAHDVETASFAKGRVKDLCANFKTELPFEMKGSARFVFENAIVSLSVRLFYRPDFVALEKRQPKVWVKPEDVRWRSVEEEPPKAGKPVLVLGSIKKPKRN